MSALRHIFSDKDQELLEAARTGKNDTIEKLLRKRQTSGTTLLPSFLKSINVNCVDREGGTPLHHAALNGHKSTVEILLRENASLNVIDSRGCSPLHLASWKGHSDICLIFLTHQSGPSIVNLQNGTGDTALHNAAQFGYSATVEVLLQNNADPSIRNLKDESPLDLGARFGKIEVVQCLLNKYPELVRSSILNHSPLHLAAACGHKQIVELLLDFGYEINTKTDNGTALHVAAVYCKTDIAKLLLERGIDCCDIDKDGLTVLQLLKLHEKTQTSYTEVIKAITEHMLMLDSQKKMSAAPALEEAEVDETPVYDTLVEHVKPKPRPRTSIELKTEVIGKDASDLYAKPMKDGSGRGKHTSPLKSPTCTPPIPPRQSTISLLDPETSPVLRRISEVSNERDSANLAENSTTPSPDKSGNPSPHRRPILPPKVRTIEERRIVSMIDLPKVPKKTGSPTLSPLGLSSANSRSLKDLNAEPPVPCNGQNTESGFSYFDMSSKQMDKSQVKPTKPPRLKKSLSPTPDRHTTRDINWESESSDAKKPTESESKGQTEYEVMSKVKSPEPSPNIDTYSISVSRSSLESETKGDKSSDPTTVNAEGADGGSEYYNLLESVERESSGFTPSCVSPMTKTYSPMESGADGANVFSVYSNVSEVEQQRADGVGASLQSERGSGGFNMKCGATLSSDAGLDSDVSSVLQNNCDISNNKDSENVTDDKQTSESVKRQSCYDNMDAEKKEGIVQSQNGDIKQNSTNYDIPEQVSVVKGDNCDKLICDKPSEPVGVDNVQEVTTVDKRSSSGAVTSEDREDRLSNSLSEDHVIGASGSQEENDVDIEAKIAKPPSLEFHQKRILKDSFPLTPTGYVQPPTPDFPPPSPHTAMQGIHARISDIDNKRTSQDMETITDADMMKESSSSDIPSGKEKDIPTSEDVANGNSSSNNIPAEVNDKVEVKVEEVKDEDEEEVVVMRRSSKRESTSSIDDVVSDDSLGPFAGLLRGSVIHTPRKVVSQISENVGYQHSRPTNRKSLPTTGLAFDTVKEEDTDIDRVMATIAMAKQDKHLTGGGQEHDSQFDDSEEWAKIENIMASFGGGIARESVFVRELEPNFTKQLAKDTAQIQCIGDWLERIDLGQYENTLIANGFDDTDFLSEAIMDEHDLETIGITSPEHRKRILDAAKTLPQIQPIDPDNPPSSVEEWLSSLHLLDIKDTFISHKYETMDRVLKLWELELTTVLDISAIGHRKRILASLKNRPPPDKRFPSLKRRTKDPNDENTPFKDVNLYKDYTNVKPLASSEEDVKEPTPAPPVDSSEEEDVFRKDSQGKAIRDSTIHLRPPHLAHTTSPIRQWRHRPEMLIKGCCNYTAQYLGSTLVKELIGTESTIEGIAKLKKSADLIAKIPTIMLSISYKGVKFIDAKSKKVICDHEIGNIFCACQDAENMNFFAYITRDNQTGKHYCHVFSVRVAGQSVDLAREIILTLGEAFEVAYQMALKERAGSEATEFERKLSQSDHEDTTSISSKASVNTV